MPILAFLAAQALATATAPASVSEVVVPGGPAPRITATFPAEGATVAGGELAFKVSFDQVMDGTRWAYAPASDAAFPKCLGQPRLLADRRTFVLLCAVKTNTAYAVSLSAPQGFAGAAGRVAAPLVLKFSTSAEIVDDLNGALDEAGLAGSDEPIMTWNGR